LRWKIKNIDIDLQNLPPDKAETGAAALGAD
jgi:hypothetical protein